MKYGVYVLVDLVADQASPPFFQTTDSSAVRMVETHHANNLKANPMYRPNDYELYRIAQYDDAFRSFSEPGSVKLTVESVVANMPHEAENK